MYGKSDLEKDLIGLVNKVEYNHETRGDLEGLFQYCSQRFRGPEMKGVIISKRSGGKTKPPEVKAVNPDKKNVFQPAEEKKTEMTSPVVPEPEKPEPVKADPTILMKVIDLYAEGIEKTKAKYPKPSDFKKELAYVGIIAKGDFDALWSALETEYNKINS